MTVKPVSPDDVVDLKIGAMPDAVIETFNLLIAEKMNNGVATFK